MKTKPKQRLLAIGEANSVHFLSRTVALSHYCSETFIMSEVAAIDSDYWHNKLENVKIVSVPHGKLVRLKFFFHLLFNRFDVVFVHGAILRDRVELQIIQFLKLLNANVITHAMGYDVLEEQIVNDSSTKSRQRIEMTKQVLAASNLVIAKNQNLYNAIKQMQPKANAKIFDWGLDDSVFFYIKNKVVKDSNEFVLFSPRGLNSFYRIFEIVKAYVLFIRQNPNITTKLLQTGYDCNEVYKKEIIDYLKNEGLTERVKFLPSLVPVEVAHYYQTVDCTIMFPPSDGLPQSLLESFSCGTPVVGPPIAPYFDWVNNDKLGILSESDKVEDLSRAIEIMHNNIKNFGKKIIVESCLERVASVNSLNRASKMLIEDTL